MSLRRARRPRRGQALIEFAVVLPVILVAFFALFDVSRMFFTQLSLDAAAQAAGRLLAMNDPSVTRGDVYKAALSQAPGVRLSPAGLRYQRLDGVDGQPVVEVELSGEYELLSAFYVTRYNTWRLRARARAPVRTDVHGGEVHLP